MIKDKLSIVELLLLVEGHCELWENSDKSLETAQVLLDSIYKSVHSHRRTPCYNTHEDWRKEAIATYNAYKKSGLM